MHDLHGNSQLIHPTAFNNRLQLQSHALLVWYGLAATHHLEPSELIKDHIDGPLELGFALPSFADLIVRAGPIAPRAKRQNSIVSYFLRGYPN
jgi:hypothetical protein